jgi:hypothetical protein
MAESRQMPRPVRVRNLARSLDLTETQLLSWLAEHAPEAEARHPADFVPPAVVDRAFQSLRRVAAPPRERVEARCAECMHFPAAPDVRLVAASAETACAICNGSVNKRAAVDLIHAFRARGLRRLLVVGGGPGTAEDLRALLSGDIDVRIVDGEAHRNATQADSEIRWADIVAVWSSTILPHKVSRLYTDHRAEIREKLVTVPRRGVAALCRAVIEKAGNTGR